jgi:hypothetical protein
MIRRFTIALFALLASSCGSVSDLQPQAGKALPQKPALASRALTAEELLELPPQADPDRVDELNKRGAVREGDPFDLPPPDGEAVPLPEASSQPKTPSTTGPDNQEPQRP